MSPRTTRSRTTRPRSTPRNTATYAAGALSLALVLALAGVSATAADGSPSRAGAGAGLKTQSAIAGAGLPPSDAAAAARGRSLPGRIGARPGVKQMITVTAKNWSTEHATLKAWWRDGHGHWHVKHGPLPVIVGYNGWVRAGNRVQSTGTTPAGRFRLPYAFGRLADPGAHLNYRRFDSTDWWPYEPRDPATYNVWQWHKARSSHWRSDKAEHLWSYPQQYAYGVVIGFNLPSRLHYSHRKRQWVADHRADTGRGGGIFLHVRGNGATAGCVAMARPNMRWLIRWLRPAAHAQIVMGPYKYVVRL